MDSTVPKAISPEAREEIKQLISDMVYKKIDNHESETEYKPFFEALFSKKAIMIGSIMQSFYTSFGMTAYEQISVIIAKGAGFEAKRQYSLLGTIDSKTETIIASYWETLKKDLKNKKPVSSNKVKEIKMIKDSIEPGNAEIDGDSTVDVFLKDKAGNEYFIDITTVKNNLKGFESLKLKMLRWIALRASTDKTVNANSYIAIPYNPYYPEPYARWNSTIIDPKDDIKVQEDYWNFIGNNPNTYKELLEIFEEVGKELRDKIDEMFKDSPDEDII